MRKKQGLQWWQALSRSYSTSERDESSGGHSCACCMPSAMPDSTAHTLPGPQGPNFAVLLTVAEGPAKRTRDGLSSEWCTGRQHKEESAWLLLSPSLTSASSSDHHHCPRTLFLLRFTGSAIMAHPTGWSLGLGTREWTLFSQRYPQAPRQYQHCQPRGSPVCQHTFAWCPRRGVVMFFPLHLAHEEMNANKLNIFSPEVPQPGGDGKT